MVALLAQRLMAPGTCCCLDVSGTDQRQCPLLALVVSQSQPLRFYVFSCKTQEDLHKQDSFPVGISEILILPSSMK